MESTDSSTATATATAAATHHQPNLPPGFRFHPTDEELVVHYLKKKASSSPLPVSIIAEVDLYKFDPWELPAKATFGEQEWYFFSPRDRKYPNGARPNRAATSGYWKATGTDKPVLTSGGTQKVGVKKALVFYGGKPPKGIKTNWIMHEYRLADNNKVINKPPGCDLANKKNSLRLDDWVLCRIYKKNNTNSPIDHDKEDSLDHEMNMMGSISMLHAPPPPPSMMLQNSTKLHLPKGLNLTTYGALLDNNNTTNLFDGIINQHQHQQHHLNGSISLSTTSSKQLTMDSLKRTLPSWQDQEDNNNNINNNTTTSKRFHGETSSEHETRDGSDNINNNGSIATLLNQIPQTPSPPLHQQSLLGSLGDGIFRQPYQQLPGMNWYT